MRQEGSRRAVGRARKACDTGGLGPGYWIFSWTEVYVKMAADLNGRRTSSVPSSVLQAEPGFEYPGDYSQASSQESQGHGHADADAHIGGAVKAPAEAADQVHDGIEQAEGAPGRRQHVDRIKGAAEEGERGDDQHGNELQLLETPRPDSDD